MRKFAISARLWGESSYNGITLYGIARRQEERQSSLLLRRRKRTRRPPATHCSPGLSRPRRKGGRARQRPNRSPSFGSHRSGLRLARLPLAGSPAHRRFLAAPVSVALLSLRPLAGALSVVWPPSTVSATPDRKPKSLIGMTAPSCVPSGALRRSVLLRKSSGTVSTAFRRNNWSKHRSDSSAFGDRKSVV